MHNKIKCTYKSQGKNICTIKKKGQCARFTDNILTLEKRYPIFRLSGSNFQGEGKYWFLPSQSN